MQNHTADLIAFFTHLGSAHIKDARKTLMKLTLGRPNSLGYR